MSDWTTARVVRDRDGRLWMRYGTRSLESEDPGEPDTNTTGLGSNYGPLTPVLDADGQPVVRTMGDLTARHIGRRVRWDDDEEEGVLDFLGAERCRFECLADLDGRENPRTYGAWLPLNTPCEVLP